MLLTFYWYVSGRRADAGWEACPDIHEGETRVRLEGSSSERKIRGGENHLALPEKYLIPSSRRERGRPGRPGYIYIYVMCAYLYRPLCVNVFYHEVVWEHMCVWIFCKGGRGLPTGLFIIHAVGGEKQEWEAADGGIQCLWCVRKA